MTEPIPIQELQNHIGKTLNYEYKDDEGKGESGKVTIMKATSSYIFGYLNSRNSFVEFFNFGSVKFYITEEKPQNGV